MSNTATESNWLEVSESEEDDQNEDNIIQILVASDINLGFEKTVKRDQEDDSFRTFEEILKYAVDYNVDAILLAGNLFYQSNPPLDVIMRCISLLRLYCMNQKPVKIDCLTDPEWIFSHCPFKIVNFKDPNLNIGLPIFSIYGNRDNPVLGPIGSLDLLAATGLINYFGKWIEDNDEIGIPPLLLRKGLTTLALYGLNHMNDAKLSKLIKRDKLKLLKENSIRNIFNLLVLHQNRAHRNRTENMFVNENLIPDMVDLVIWGHEPVCRVEHETVPSKTFRISQPGSTIATSLTRGETIRKKVGLLRIYKDAFQMKYLKLKTIRPFVFDSLNLNENNEIFNIPNQPRTIERFGSSNSRTCIIEKFIDKFIANTLLPRAQKQVTGHPNQPKKPLIRLKIIHDNESDRFSINKLAKKFQDLVANTNDMIVFSNSSLLINSLDDDDDGDDYEELSSIYFRSEKRKWRRTVEGSMSEYFNQDENKDKLTVLPLNDLNKALLKFKKNDHASFERTVRDEIETTVNHLIHHNVEVDDALEAIQDYRNG